MEQAAKRGFCIKVIGVVKVRLDKLILRMLSEVIKARSDPTEVPTDRVCNYPCI